MLASGSCSEGCFDLGYIFGNFKRGSICVTKFFDNNRDGQQGAYEIVLAGIEFCLIKGNVLQYVCSNSRIRSPSFPQ